MSDRQIIMTFSSPPCLEDLEVIAAEVLESLPEEILEFCEDLAVQVEELADEATELEQDLDDPYDLLVLFKSGKEISPGVEKKIANDDDVLILYRRPLLDVWIETGEDLTAVVRQHVIEELGSCFDFQDAEIEEMSARHYQGML